MKERMAWVGAVAPVRVGHGFQMDSPAVMSGR